MVLEPLLLVPVEEVVEAVRVVALEEEIPLPLAPNIHRLDLSNKLGNEYPGSMRRNYHSACDG